MVGVAQLVEHSVVVRDVAGSSPVAHPTKLPNRYKLTEILSAPRPLVYIIETFIPKN